MNTPHRVAIVGAGIAGAAVAQRLARRNDTHVTVISAPLPRSTDTNQRWKHSGFLFTRDTHILQAWKALQNLDPQFELPFVKSEGSLYVASDPVHIETRLDKWRQLLPEQVNAVHRTAVSAANGLTDSRFPQSYAAATAPDLVIDFTASTSSLLRSAEQHGARILRKVSLAGLDLGRQRPELRISNGEILCVDTVVIATGAFTRRLFAMSDLVLPLQVRRCPTVHVDDGHSRNMGIVCVLDAREKRHGSRDLTIVKLGHLRILAEPDGDLIDDDEMLSDPYRSPTRTEVEQLVSDVEHAHRLTKRLQVVRSAYCYKAEMVTATHPLVPLTITNDTLPSLPAWLTIALPGKASFGITLAEQVAGSILQRRLGHSEDAV